MITVFSYDILSTIFFVGINQDLMLTMNDEFTPVIIANHSEQYTNSNLQNHLQILTDETSPLQSNHIAHDEIESGKPFQCSICKKQFPQSSYLKEHMKIHGIANYVELRKPFQCSLCKKQFLKSSYLGEHMKIHGIAKQFECSVCSRRFSQKGNLKKHLRTHTGEKPFGCAICGFSFGQKWDLKRHIITHFRNGKNGKANPKHRKTLQTTDTGNGKDVETTQLKNSKMVQTIEINDSSDFSEYPTMVNENVEDSFKQNSIVSQLHQLSEYTYRTESQTSSTSPYKCSQCNRSFAGKSNLKKHLYIHSGEKPFSCVFCRSGFRQKWDLKRHIITRHPSENLTSEILRKSDLSKRVAAHPSRDSTSEVEKEIDLSEEVIVISNEANVYKKDFIINEVNPVNTLNGLGAEKSDLPKKVIVINKEAKASEKDFIMNEINHVNKLNGICHFKPTASPGLTRKANNVTNVPSNPDDRISESQIELLNSTSDTKVFACSYCSKTFSQSGNLSTHLKIHTGDRHKCLVCGREFTQKGNLKKHMRTHSGEKPYSCAICLSSFAQKWDLKRHIRTHKSENNKHVPLEVTDFYEHPTMITMSGSHTDDNVSNVLNESDHLPSVTLDLDSEAATVHSSDLPYVINIKSEEEP